MPAVPKKAATVILLRDSKSQEGFEVFLLKRHEKSSFMGGNYVFPGGRVDREDGSVETCALSKGLTPEQACRILGGSLSEEESLAYWIAGIRELFEEAGILLAYDENNELFRLKTDEDRKTLEYHRSLLQKGERTICQMASELRILFALDQIHYFAHWITPEARALRFDTRFFLARYPEGQEASFDRKETIAEVWLTPRKALEENLRGKVALSPPTLQIMEDLSQFENLEAVFSSLRRKEIKPILPILKDLGGEVLLFPWDPEYEVFKRGEIPPKIDHGRPSNPGDTTTRLLYREGFWLPYCRIS
ncbi:MAG: hypothetical protein N3G78_13550 [Desulfobacterota bacterium]|nr:hypothetical protein [Thermodesulfobacteriota bacterium]